MRNNDQEESSNASKATQDISTEELVENDYDVPMPDRSPPGENSEPQTYRDPEAHSDPGRTPYTDSIHASSEDTDRSDDGYEYDAGHEMTAATGVGKPDDTDYDDTLQRINDGRHPSDGELSQRESEWDKKRIAQALCSDLPISKRQREKVVQAMEFLDLDRFGHQKSIERVCLGVVAVIVNDERVEQATDPNEVTLVTWEDSFQSVAEKFDVSMSDLSTIKETVRTEVDHSVLEPSNTGVRRDLHLPKVSPSDKPDEYWENQPNTHWVWLARTWDRQDDDLKEAIPQEKRELIYLLRKWEPWNRAAEVPSEEYDEADQHLEREQTAAEENSSAESNDEMDMDEIRAEAEALVEEMIEESE